MEIKNTCQRWCWPTGWEPLVCSKAEYGGRKKVAGGIVQTFSYWFKYFNVIGTRPLPETEEETGGFGGLKKKHKTVIEKARPFAYGSWENARHHFRNYLEHGQGPHHGSWNGFVLFSPFFSKSNWRALKFYVRQLLMTMILSGVGIRDEGPNEVIA